MNKSSLKRWSQAGFTMVELLIVLTIVTIVALLVANNIEEAISKARNVERRNDIDNIQRALESYWHEHESYPEDLNSLDISFESLTDPSGGYISVIPASSSNNKPDSGYKTSKPVAEEASEEAETESEEAESPKPAAEYTYAAYDCRPPTVENDEESEQNEESEEDASVGATTAPEVEEGLKCHKYVLYSWLEKADEEEIPYELENLHTTKE